MSQKIHENSEAAAGLKVVENRLNRIKSLKDSFVLKYTIVRYFFVGGAAALVDILIFYFFADLLGFNYLWITFFGFIAATLVNYVLSILFVFESGTRFHWNYEVILIYLISVVALSVHIIVLYISIEVFSIALMISKFIAVGSAFIFNYSLRKYYVFKAKT